MPRCSARLALALALCSLCPAAVRAAPGFDFGVGDEPGQLTVDQHTDASGAVRDVLPGSVVWQTWQPGHSGRLAAIDVYMGSTQVRAGECRAKRASGERPRKQ